MIENLLLDRRHADRRLRRVLLNPAPTPIMAARALSEKLGGPQLWIKRDDLIPFGFGGNKVRGLELILADALEQGADTLVTGAGPLSNHVRATAAAAAYSGMRMVAVYWGKPPERIQGNHYLSALWGAEFRFTENYDRSSVDPELEAEVARRRALGARPYLIPRGGACPLGVIGHALAVQETLLQCNELGVQPRSVVMAVGSGSMSAGWLLGSALFEAPWRIEGITVSQPAKDMRARVLTLAREAAELLGKPIPLASDEIVIHDGFIGEGYGKPTMEGDEALAIAARHEGFLLDPIYTGKTLAGYRALLNEGHYRDQDFVLFLHSGGAPGVFVEREAPK